MECTNLSTFVKPFQTFVFRLYNTNVINFSSYMSYCNIVIFRYWYGTPKNFLSDLESLKNLNIKSNEWYEFKDGNRRPVATVANVWRESC